MPIDDRRFVWLFGDTYLGGGPYGGQLNVQGLVRNSIVLQSRENCFFYLFGGNATNGWRSAIPDQADGSFYWPKGGTFDPATGLLSVMALLVRTTVPNSLWGWELVGTDVIRYRVSDMTFVGRERLFTYGDDDRALFGLSLLKRSGQVYLYGCSTTASAQCFVARTDALMHASSIQFWSNGVWLRDLEQAAPIGWSEPVGGDGGAPLYAGNVAGGVLASHQIEVLGGETWGWLGSAATGAFAPLGRIWDTRTKPVGPLPSNWFTYEGKTINTSAGTIGMFNVNTFDDEAGRVAGVYGPRFLGPSAPHLYLTDSLDGGRPPRADMRTPWLPADRDYVYVAPIRGTVMTCDWNGDGVDTPAVFSNGRWYLTDGQTGGAWALGFGFGTGGDRPVCGDWNGDGTDTPGVVRNNTWYLTNTVKPHADVPVGYGVSTDRPIVGDWSADETYTGFVRNTLTFRYGLSTDRPIVGDWNGDGTDTPGVVRNNTWYLTNTIVEPHADVTFRYGVSTDRPIVGDWNGDGTDTPGVVRNNTWYLTNTIVNPYADVTFRYGVSGDVPVVGRWAPGAPTTVGISRPTF